MKITRLSFYGSGRVTAEADPSGQFCRIADLPQGMQEALFDPIPKRGNAEDDDDDKDADR